MIGLLFSAFGILLTAILHQVINNQANLEAELKNGDYTISVSSFYKYFAFFLFFLSAVILVAIAIDNTLDGYTIGGVLFLLSVYGGYYFYSYYKNFLLRFNSNKIEYTNQKGELMKTSWDQIQQIKFNTISQELVVTTRAGKVKIPKSTKGFNTFLNLMEEKTKYRRSGLKL